MRPPGDEGRSGALAAILFPVLVLSCASAPLAAQDATLDDVLKGFDAPATSPPAEVDEVLRGFETAPATPATTAAAQKQRAWELNTDLSLSASYNYAHDAPEPGAADYRGLSRLRLKVQPEFKYRFNERWDSVVMGSAFRDFSYALNGRDDYPDAVLDAYESEAEWRDVYLRGKLTDRLDLKLGRQIVVWGKADSLRVVDVLNPLDNREPGMVDIEDLRLPLTMTRLDYYFGAWSLTAIAIHEIRFNKNPPFGGDFNSAPNPPPPEDVPEDFGGNTEYAMALGGLFSGWDISFHAARVFDDAPYQVATPSGARERRHARVTLGGIAANVVEGSWLFKSELAYLSGLRFFNVADRSLSRLDVLLGAEYNGIADTVLAVEFANRHLLDYDGALAAGPDNTDQDSAQTALRYTGSFLHDRLELVALAVIFGDPGQDGSFFRFSAQCELHAALLLTGGVITYQSGDYAMLQDIGDKDRLFVEVKYSF